MHEHMTALIRLGWFVGMVNGYFLLWLFKKLANAIQSIVTDIKGANQNG